MFMPDQPTTTAAAPDEPGRLPEGWLRERLRESLPRATDEQIDGLVALAEEYGRRLREARTEAVAAVLEQPPIGGLCEECGHLAGRHRGERCHFPRHVDNPCTCAGMLWLGRRWPRPWLPAPDGLTAPEVPDA